MIDPITGIAHLAGFLIVEVATMVKSELHARSPARAVRRAKRGFPQHHRTVPDTKIFQMGDTLYMHPTVARELRRRTPLLVPGSRP